MLTKCQIYVDTPQHNDGLPFLLYLSREGCGSVLGWAPVSAKYRDPESSLQLQQLVIQELKATGAEATQDPEGPLS